jgi:NTP pyrophosphatase (non-canonical NTP hydrolase)
MDLSNYQRHAWEYAQYPHAGSGHNPEYPTLGLAGEAGEIANKIKKIQRDHLDHATMREDISAELGDVLWYAAALATELGLSLDVIAQMNLHKLADRKARNVIRGSGDNR